MKKLKRLSIVLLAALTISSFNVMTASAKTIQSEQKKPEIEVLGYDPGLNGYEYVPSRKDYNISVDWRHEANNWVSGTTDTVSYTVSRTVSTSMSSSISTTVNGMIAQANVGLEVQVGVTTTRSTTLAFSIPYGKYECQYGSKLVHAYGTENYWSMGKLQSSKYVNGKWTYMPYSNKVKL